MDRALLRNVTALGLGLAVLAPPAAWSRESCLEKVEEIQAHLDDREEILDPRAAEGINMPNLSHLIEAARQFAARGEEERCFEVVEDMAGYLERLADTPAVATGGSSVVPDQPPPLQGEQGNSGVRKEPGGSDLTRPGLGESEELDEAGLGETAEARRGGGAGDGGAGGAAADAGSTVREGVSPVVPPDPGAEREGAAADPTATGTENRFAQLRVEEFIGMPLINNWGREIGYIVDLVTAQNNPQEVYAVVSEDGESPGNGGAGAIVPLERLRMAHPKAIQLRREVEAEGLTDLPAYNPTGYEPVSRTQRLGEVVGAQGLSVD